MYSSDLKVIVVFSRSVSCENHSVNCVIFVGGANWLIFNISNELLDHLDRTRLTFPCQVTIDKLGKASRVHEWQPSRKGKESSSSKSCIPVTVQQQEISLFPNSSREREKDHLRTNFIDALVNLAGEKISLLWDCYRDIRAYGGGLISFGSHDTTE